MSFLLDRTNRCFLAMASVEGGMEIEEVAETKPEALAKVLIDPLAGVDLDKAKEIVREAKFPEELVDRVADVLVKLWETFVSRMRRSSRSTRWFLIRQARSSRSTARCRWTRTLTSAIPITQRSLTTPRQIRLRSRPRRRASTTSKLSGEVGIIGNGAGLVMSTLDVVAYAVRGVRWRSPRTSSTSVAEHRRRSWRTA